ncbi:23107_t:CDS:2, partial [Cetraspora pellucida]
SKTKSWHTVNVRRPDHSIKLETTDGGQEILLPNERFIANFESFCQQLENLEIFHLHDVEAVEEMNEIGQGEKRQQDKIQDEKAKKVQNLMTFNWQQNEKKSTDNLNTDIESIEDDIKPTYT